MKRGRCGFCTSLDPVDQPTPSYRLLIGNTSAEDFANIDNHISFSSSVMQSKTVSKLLPYLGVCSRRYYWFEEGEVAQSSELPFAVIELRCMHSFANLNKTDVVFAASEAKELEAAV